MRCIVVFFVGFLTFAPASSAAQAPRDETFETAGRQVHYEVFSSGGPQDPLLILLPGTSGPEGALYRSQAMFFASHGYTTLLLHYFDAASSHTAADATYRAWARALADLVRFNGSHPALHRGLVYVVGYSLGASVALAAGSQNLPVQAIAEWYGSLPDSFFTSLKGMPPLLILHGVRDNNIPPINAQQLVRLCGMKSFDCADHIYPDESHGFSDAGLADADRRTLQFFADHTKIAVTPSP